MKTLGISKCKIDKGRGIANLEFLINYFREGTQLVEFIFRDWIPQKECLPLFEVLQKQKFLLTVELNLRDADLFRIIKNYPKNHFQINDWCQ